MMCSILDTDEQVAENVEKAIPLSFGVIQPIMEKYGFVCDLMTSNSIKNCWDRRYVLKDRKNIFEANLTIRLYGSLVASIALNYRDAPGCYEREVVERAIKNNLAYLTYAAGDLVQFKQAIRRYVDNVFRYADRSKFYEENIEF